MLARVCCVLIGYCCGLLQTGYIYGKLNGIDIRSVGSGNAGTTNMLRTLGPKAGLITLLFDALKTVFAISISWLVFHASNADIMPLLELYAAAGAILGHDFPFYMHFKGGKGIAATAGLILGLHDPIILILGIITFFGIFATTHYVSLGSLSVYVGLVTECVVMGQLHYGRFKVLSQNSLIEFYVVLILLAVLAFYQHRANIHRLLTGTERKTYISKEKNKAEAERYNNIVNK